MAICKIIFWFSIFMIFYSYVGYILVLWLISLFKLKNSEKCSATFLPKVSLLISAYNEEEVIEDKILNSLELNYPKDLLEIVVISDDSDDRTHDIVTQYADRGVVLKHYKGRIGKTACLNNAVPLAKGDVIVFSDANSKYDREAIKKLVRNFADESIGFVTGTTRYITNDNGGTMDSVRLYSRIEKNVKILESDINSCVGADGAIFAIRKSLYKPLKDFDINDFVIPLNVIKQGFRGKLESDAFCIEKTASDTKGEFKRQIRITNRTIRAIFNNMIVLNPFKFGLFTFELISHKLCKFLVPFFMLAIFITSIILITQGKVYFIIFLLQVCFYLVSLLNYRVPCFKGLSSLASASYTFTTINMAILWGWVQYFKGETYTTWSHGRR